MKVTANANRGPRSSSTYPSSERTPASLLELQKQTRRYDKPSDEVLKKIYYKNALRLIPGIDASAFPK